MIEVKAIRDFKGAPDGVTVIEVRKGKKFHAKSEQVPYLVSKAVILDPDLIPKEAEKKASEILDSLEAQVEKQAAKEQEIKDRKSVREERRKLRAEWAKLESEKLKLKNAPDASNVSLETNEEIEQKWAEIEEQQQVLLEDREKLEQERQRLVELAQAIENQDVQKVLEALEQQLEYAKAAGEEVSEANAAFHAEVSEWKEKIEAYKKDVAEFDKAKAAFEKERKSSSKKKK